MTRKDIEDIEIFKLRAIEKRDLDFHDAKRIVEIGLKRPFLVIAQASEIREHFKGKDITLCMIVNAKSGLCSEDCKFCAQSIYYNTNIEVYPLLSLNEILEKARIAKDMGAHMLGIVTSGPSLEEEEEWKTVLDSVKSIHDIGLKPCASLGMLDEKKARELKNVGLFRYHHNLETSERFFDNICSTHTFSDKIKTIKIAKKVGLSICSGGIIGMGESMEERIKLALALKELDVDSVPINILNPRPGTPLANVKGLKPMEILITLSIFRFLLPEKDIRLCAGREVHLRQLLPLAIIAGCNSLMTGDYLTTKGRSPDLDKEMIEDLELNYHI